LLNKAFIPANDEICRWTYPVMGDLMTYSDHTKIANEIQGAKKGCAFCWDRRNKA
jgi:hypothetical protein